MNLFFIVLSSILYAISFPKFNFWWFAFVALVPFFYALENTDSGLKNFLYGMLWSAGHAIGMGYWAFFSVLNHYEVPFAKSVLFFTLCVILPVLVIYSGFAVFYGFLHRRHLFFYVLVVPSLWVLAEYLKSVFSFLIPWGGLEYALVPFTAFIQVADVIGGYGILFLVAAINSLFVYFLKQFTLIRKSQIDEVPFRGPNHPRSVFIVSLPLFLILLFVCIPVLYGTYQLRKIDRVIGQGFKSGNAVCAVLVQGNFSTKERWSGMGFYQRVMRYLEMSGEPSGKTNKNADAIKSRVIVWPETILNSSSKVNDALFVEIMRYIGKNTLLIAGGLKSDDRKKAVYNSAYFISGAGRLLRYDKHILLPYSETSPFIDLLDAYYTAPDEFASGQTPVSIDAPGGMVGASICFEILYPGFIRQAVKEGAVYLVNISNDSWFGDSPMPYIHLNAARLRAVENRRFLLRTSNSGISAVIAPTGRITAQSNLFTKERVDGSFLKMNQLDFYTRYGNLILAGSFLILITALMRMVLKKD